LNIEVLISLYYLNIHIFRRTKFGGEFGYPIFFGRFSVDKNSATANGLGV